MEHIPFHKPSVGEEEMAAVLDVMRSGWLTTGPRTKEFEARFAEYVGARHAVALNSCTAALHLALEALGTRAGDVVLTTPMTFAATAEVVRYFGARPVFVDIEPDTMNIDPRALAATLARLAAEGARPRAVIPVHFAGHPCDMDPIAEAAAAHGVPVIEDAAHTLPASYKGRSVGTLSAVTCFSFYATKTITTGEGGMAVTDDPALADRMRIMGLHGISRDAWKRYTAEGNWSYEIVAPGYKYNMTDLAAAIGLAQLPKAETFRARREAIAGEYTRAFRDLDACEVPAVRSDVVHSWHLYVLRLNLPALAIDRARFIEELRGRGIGTSVHFIPLHLHPYYRETYGYAPGDFPVSYASYGRSLSLPLWPGMGEDAVGRVVEAVREVARIHAR
jgi:dTDP-4-amino-4,6-dideoxygalactose transaminase